MNVLIIEDNDIKYGLIESALESSGLEVNKRRASSYQSGISALLERTYDYVILDMTLPVYDNVHAVVGAEELTFGGELILREISRRRVVAKFIVLSQYISFLRNGVEVAFGDLRLELMRKYTPAVVACIRLDNSSVEWRDQMLSILKGP